MTFDGKKAPVSRVKTRQGEHIRELRYRNLQGNHLMRRLRTTDEHQYWVMNRNRWLLAKDLEAGDRLMLPDGEKAEIYETIRYPVKAKVYNLDVAGYETYFANGVLVYQDCGGQTTDRVNEQLQAYLRGRGLVSLSKGAIRDGDESFVPIAHTHGGTMSPPKEREEKGGRP